MTEIDLEKIRQEALSASLLMENEDFKALLLEVEQEAFEALKKVEIGDRDGLSAVHAVAFSIGILRQKLQAKIDNGVYATAQLEKMRK